ncbi:AzlC family ABC transporter permease [Streptacidiphilus sp. P02-A3a]|uniref:AzlC family ABC transporter permease n=1 Tax=Streptacidiphilus sp. P02-A3a TaxID=2704468 RepID=UPI0015FCC09D|nr:AzlC family ABC transporter permease [Streptacidiphilus sp. P02-A3a]QMU72249.1 AzlC family ABC transporter permease [Streptacidiphilus sp. P02-A3a]
MTALQQTDPPPVAPPPRPSDRAVTRDSLTVGLTVGASGAAFGVAGAAAHLTVAQTCALSLLVFTGASQFALVGALVAGAAGPAAVAGALFLGLRNCLYGLRLGARLRIPRALRPLAAQLVIDETTAVSLVQPDQRSARIGFTVTGISLYLVWNLTTLAGALGAGALGDPGRYGLDAAGPAVFLALLGPRLREGGTERGVAALAVLLAVAAVPVLPGGTPVLLAVAAVPLALALRRARGGAGERR